MTNRTNKEKRDIQYAFGGVDDKRICSAELSYGKWEFPITKKMDDSSMVLYFKYSMTWVHLFPGTYVYIFDGEAKHENQVYQDFGDEIRFTLNDKGQIEI